FEPYLERDLLELLYPSPGGEADAQQQLDSTLFTQPVLFTLEYALAQMWLDWGVQPRAMLGHSLGEYAAACLAGVFTLEDGVRLVASRARLMQDLPGGSMLAVSIAEQDIHRWLSDDVS